MKFSNLHKTISIALSVLILFSTLSLTIEKQFCGDVLIDIAVFSESEKCDTIASKIEPAETVKKSCCKEEIHVIDGLSETTITTFNDLETIQKQVLVAHSFSYIKLIEYLPNLDGPRSYYNSPKLVKDLQILEETFLI